MRAITILIIGLAAATFCTMESSAVAASPAWWHCASVVKGYFEDKGCTKVNEKSGGFEWESIGKAVGIKGKGSLNFADSAASSGSLRAPNRKRFWDAVVVDGVYGETTGQ